MDKDTQIKILSNALALICKPRNICTKDELNFLAKFSGEDEIAYIALVRAGCKPAWEIEMSAGELEDFNSLAR